MAVTEDAPVLKAVVSLPTNQQERSNPFATAKAAAEAAVDQSPFELAAVQETALTVRTPSPVEQQQKQKKKVSFSKKLFICGCVRPAVSDAGLDFSDGHSLTASSDASSLSDVQRKKGGAHWQDISPKKSLTLAKQASAAYTDVDW